MRDWRYTTGLHDIGNGLYAYLQPGPQGNGSWGWSNAGLIVDGEASLLVDTLYDLKLTQAMLDEMRRATQAAESFDVVVNTHANGDHCYGNQLVSGSQIVSTRACAEEMAELPPGALHALLQNAPSLGKVGEFVQNIFGSFEFADIVATLPTSTFAGEKTIEVGSKEIRLIEVGPAHTRGDLLVHVPADRVVYTGDILFAGAHPVMWAGPVSNWLAACDRVLAMDVDVVVPGHGPISDKGAIRNIKGYWEYLSREARARYDAGLAPLDAARDISFADYATWGEAERVVVNISMLYREFSGEGGAESPVVLFGQMAELAV